MAENGEHIVTRYKGTCVHAKFHSDMLQLHAQIQICGSREVHFFLDRFRMVSLLLRRWPKSSLFFLPFPHGTSPSAEMAEKCTFLGPHAISPCAEMAEKCTFLGPHGISARAEIPCGNGPKKGALLGFHIMLIHNDLAFHLN